MVNQLTSQFQKAHNIYIDTQTGYLYVVGSPNANLIVYDLQPDPANPTWVASVSWNRQVCPRCICGGFYSLRILRGRGHYIFDLTPTLAPAQASRCVAY
ncbi:MAG: hypothetical protein R2795_08645 [Saprospiraceae bacterium]